MAVSGKRNIKKIAAAVVLSAAFGGVAGYIVLDDPAPDEPVPTTDTADNTSPGQTGKGPDEGLEEPACIYINEEHRKFFGAESGQEQKLMGYFNEASLSETGRNVLKTDKQDYAQICYSKALDQKNECGTVPAGSYSDLFGLIILNPNPKFDGALMPMVIVHETRHKQQTEKIGRHGIGTGNFREAEFLIEFWFHEADARLTTIMAAYELEQQGQPQYMQALRDFGGHGHMIDAFRRSLTAQPDDMAEAMRAAIRAFRSDKVLARKYDNSVLEFLEGNNYQFLPRMKADELLTDDKLIKLGKIGNYDNYMDEELMSFIRNSMTDEEFQKLSAIRKDAGGTKGAACEVKQQAVKPS